MGLIAAYVLGKNPHVPNQWIYPLDLHPAGALRFFPAGALALNPSGTRSDAKLPAFDPSILRANLDTHFVLAEKNIRD